MTVLFNFSRNSINRVIFFTHFYSIFFLRLEIVLCKLDFSCHLAHLSAYKSYHLI